MKKGALILIPGLLVASQTAMASQPTLRQWVLPWQKGTTWVSSLDVNSSDLSVHYSEAARAEGYTESVGITSFWKGGLDDQCFALQTAQLAKALRDPEVRSSLKALKISEIKIHMTTWEPGSASAATAVVSPSSDYSIQMNLDGGHGFCAFRNKNQIEYDLSQAAGDLKKDSSNQKQELENALALMGQVSPKASDPSSVSDSAVKSGSALAVAAHEAAGDKTASASPLK